MSRPISDSISTPNSYDQFIGVISSWTSPIGYRIIHLEVLTHRQNVLRLYIEHLDPLSMKAIGIEDCVKVSHAVNDQIDQVPEIGALFSGEYDLEVSSPGLNRPLRTENDFERFAGHFVRVHTYRALSFEELGNKEYQEKNPKQKNFLGKLVKIQEGKVVLSMAVGEKKGSGKKKKPLKGKSKLERSSPLSGGLSSVSSVSVMTNSAEEFEIGIPLPLISKANLEPEFEFEESDESE